MQINEIIEKIKNDPRFLKLKNVIENNTHHNHQPVYEHTMLVLNIAKEKITGDFIENKKAKELFIKFVNEKVDGDLLRKDCMVLVALLHDIGKAVLYKDGEIERKVLHTKDGITSCPGHEYISSLFIPELLKDLVSEKVISYISKIASLHDTICDFYFSKMKDWKLEDVLDDIKSKSEGLYIESLFNIYCDVYYAKPSENLREMAVKIFNSPDFYTKRVYYLK
ncbi:MAG: hypothetical protein A2W22_01265 [Candidatus Levybacteria bacterium RBG_16_35_11]|nr:MAG: hypothetical protein A2W22_01265 [Candidatus Levybacteria bacterium RBG_16_35_11]